MTKEVEVNCKGIYGEYYKLSLILDLSKDKEGLNILNIKSILSNINRNNIVKYTVGANQIILLLDNEVIDSRNEPIDFTYNTKVLLIEDTLSFSNQETKVFSVEVKLIPDDENKLECSKVKAQIVIPRFSKERRKD